MTRSSSSINHSHLLALESQLEELRTQHQALSTQLDDEVDALCTEVKDLAIAFRKDSYDFNIRLKALELKVNSQEFHVEHSQLNRVVADEDPQVTSLVRDLNSLTAEHLALQTTCDVLREDKQGLERMLNNAEDECEQLRTENEVLSTRNVALSAQLEVAEANFKAIQEICDVD